MLSTLTCSKPRYPLLVFSVGRVKLLGVSVHLRLPKKRPVKTEMGTECSINLVVEWYRCVAKTSGQLKKYS